MPLIWQFINSSVNIPNSVMIKDYSLEDINLLNTESKNYDFSIFVPDSISIVLGKGSDPENAVKWAEVISDQIDIYKRPSGGESVILSENTIVIAIVKRGEKLVNPSRYFNKYNNMIIEVLTGLGIKNLLKRGFSDICIGEKKILGSSIYRTGDTVFYHAVMNVSESTDTIEKYLKHPSREPEYRNGRNHSDFVTSIHEEGYALEKRKISSRLEEEILRLKYS